MCITLFCCLRTCVYIPDKSQEKKKRKNMKSLVPAFSIHSTGVLKRKLKFKIPHTMLCKKNLSPTAFFSFLSLFFACNNLFGAQWELIREQNKPIGNRTTTKTLIRTLEMCFESLYGREHRILNNVAKNPGVSPPRKAHTVFSLENCLFSHMGELSTGNFLNVLCQLSMGKRS